MDEKTYIITPKLDQQVLLRDHRDVWVRGTLIHFEGARENNQWNVLYTAMLGGTSRVIRSSSCIPLEGNESLEGHVS